MLPIKLHNNRIPTIWKQYLLNQLVPEQYGVRSIEDPINIYNTHDFSLLARTEYQAND